MTENRGDRGDRREFGGEIPRCQGGGGAFAAVSPLDSPAALVPLAGARVPGVAAFGAAAFGSTSSPRASSAQCRCTRRHLQQSWLPAQPHNRSRRKQL